MVRERANKINNVKKKYILCPKNEKMEVQQTKEIKKITKKKKKKMIGMSDELMNEND